MKKLCSGCHGARGEGKDAGLRRSGAGAYRYLLAQLRNFSYGRTSWRRKYLDLFEMMGGLSTSVRSVKRTTCPV